MDYSVLSCSSAVFIRQNDAGSPCLIQAYEGELFLFSIWKQSLAMDIFQVLKKFSVTKNPLNLSWSAYEIAQWKIEAFADSTHKLDTGEAGWWIANRTAPPMTSNFLDKLTMHENDEVDGGNSYQNTTDCFQCIAHKTRPYIETAVEILYQYSTKSNAFIVESIK